MAESAKNVSWNCIISTLRVGSLIMVFVASSLHLQYFITDQTVAFFHASDPLLNSLKASKYFWLINGQAFYLILSCCTGHKG